MAKRKSARASGRATAGRTRTARPAKAATRTLSRTATRGSATRATATRSTARGAKTAAARHTAPRTRTASRAERAADPPATRTAETPAVELAPPHAAAAPNGIGLAMHHLDYTSHDMEGVRRFYTDVLGFADSNLDPQMNYLYVRTGATSSLGFMPPMPGPPEQWRPPREPALYFIVDDVDRAHQELTSRGVTFDQPPTDMPWGHRTALLRDPEGRRVCLAQHIAPRS